MEYTGERAIPWDSRTGCHILVRHVQRYAWALPRVWGKRVVDLGCGAGYGTFMLSWAAKYAVGVDISEEAIMYAASRFDAINLDYGILDITQRMYRADIYVAFEILEHLYDSERVTEECRPLLWSLPIEDASKFHVRPYSLEEAEAEIGPVGWFQNEDGEIYRREHARFRPVNVLGILG